MTLQRTEAEIERQNRIRISGWAYGYEFEAESPVSDAEYDRVARMIRPEVSTGHAVLDKFFKEHYTPDSGMWIRFHPELDKVAARYHYLKRIGAYSRKPQEPIKSMNVLSDKKRKRLERKLAEMKERREAKANVGAGFTHILPQQPAKPAEPPPWLSSHSTTRTTTSLFPPPRCPRVYYTDKAWYKISYLVRECKVEVGWLGIVSRRGKDFLVEDVFVPKQIVTAGTTEISPAAYNALYTELLVAGIADGNLLYWGHSHVNMSVGPSTTDERTTQYFVDVLESPGFFIRGIYNKKGDSKVDIYVKERDDFGWIHQCVDNYLLPRELPKDEADAFEQAFLDNVEEYVPPPLPAQTASSGSYPVPVPKVTNLYASSSSKYPGERELLAEIEEGDNVVGLEDLNDPFSYHTGN